MDDYDIVSTTAPSLKNNNNISTIVPFVSNTNLPSLRRKACDNNWDKKTLISPDLIEKYKLKNIKSNANNTNANTNNKCTDYFKYNLFAKTMGFLLIGGSISYYWWKK